ncbi:hypothetical protein CMV_012409 [Castanea mollissima]|uniref:CCHC-type domain-containing protein n=1 Tax=Castanea mollissima TaxID=60419 RepID=A0A8J4R1Z4_9ROSI|nr:hypothetical protein CMV_012409 [Castanea mollissima]
MVEPTALYASNGSNPNFGPNFRPTQNQGYNGGKKGNSKKERPVCTYCGLTGHIADKCYKLHGYPPGYKPKGKVFMANQVSGVFHSENSDGSNGSFGQAQHCYINGSNAYGATQSGVNASGMQPDAITFPPQNFPSQFQGSSSQSLKCPISQSQCEQLLSYLSILKENSGVSSGIQPAHQAATVMTAAVDTSSSNNFVNNFSDSVDNPTLSPSTSSYEPPTSILHTTPSVPRQLDVTNDVPTSPNVLPSPTFATPSSIHLSPSSSPDIDPISTSSILVVLRRSTRPHHPPAYLTDYSCKAVVSKPSLGSPYDISDHLNYENLGSNFHSFVMSVTATPVEPVHFYQAVQSAVWRAAMDKEIAALEQNNTWTLTPLPFAFTRLANRLGLIDIFVPKRVKFGSQLQVIEQSMIQDLRGSVKTESRSLSGSNAKRKQHRLEEVKDDQG